MHRDEKAYGWHSKSVAKDKCTILEKNKQTVNHCVSIMLQLSAERGRASLYEHPDLRWRRVALAADFTCWNDLKVLVFRGL